MQSLEEQILQLISEYLTLMLAAAVHPEAPNKAVRKSAIHRINQLKEYPHVISELTKIKNAALPHAELDKHWRRLEEIQEGKICYQVPDSINSSMKGS